MWYDFQVRGTVDNAAGHLPVLPPETASRVSVHLTLETHFEKRQMVLERGLHQEDAEAITHRLASGAIEDQLQKAVMHALYCLASESEEFQRMGKDVLQHIDVLER